MEDSLAVRCGELEVEIYKLRRQVERARNVDQRHSHKDNTTASELQTLRDEVATLEEEYAQVSAEDSQIQMELAEHNRNLQEQISARDQYSMKIDSLQCEIERYEDNTLQQTAEMEQLEFYQQEMEAMVQKLRMNLQYSILEKEQDEIKARKLRQRVDSIKGTVTDQNELHDVMLRPQLDQILRERNEMKFKGQTLSFTNDQLQEEVEQLGGWGAQDNFSLLFGSKSQHGKMKKTSLHGFSLHSATGSIGSAARSVVDQMVRKRVDRPSSSTVKPFDDRDTCTTVDEAEPHHDENEEYLRHSPFPKVVHVDKNGNGLEISQQCQQSIGIR